MNEFRRNTDEKVAGTLEEIREALRKSIAVIKSVSQRKEERRRIYRYLMFLKVLPAGSADYPRILKRVMDQ